ELGDRPVWCQGGIGLHSAAGVRAAGAFGVVLDTVLAALPECALADELKQRLLGMDGSEVRAHDGYQYLTPASGEPPTDVVALRTALIDGSVLALGQDVGLVKRTLAACASAEALIPGLRMRMAGQFHQARLLRPLDEGSPWALAHG